RFRRQPVALVCDTAEMYLRIGIAHEDKPFHRFLWRGIDQDRQPDTYQFDRVVFGVNSSPFLAQFVLQHHAQKLKDTFPQAAETVLRSTYMDDSMDSVMNEEDGIELHRQLSQLLTQAGMHARKWLSNSSTVLKEIPLQDRKAEVDLDTGYLPSAKTLGVWWSANQDVFMFKENAPGDDMKYTKRSFLKKIATLFDPVGFLAPFTIRAKILLQEM
ncbi:MAG: A17 family peptidase, partial [Candidatus Thiodiazotropha taylori]|nr:A17 family peptidase [Candidatus Thiodiazotropha taylori]MCW4311253.1 A17 family peptidase [Candidatus Thiodiazotropha endolucinida]